MKISVFLRFSVLALVAVLPFSSRAQNWVNMDQVKQTLNTGLKHVGDYVLLDDQGHMFDAGHVVLDFDSVFTVIAKAPMAVGDCEFVHAALKSDGTLDAPGVHRMRYFFRFEDSVIRFNTDLPEQEVDVHFNFDPSKEYVQGTIRNGEKDVGVFRMRIRDFKAEKGAK